MEDEGTHEPLKIAISILIALTAVTGALISWQASRMGSRAASLDSDAIRAALENANTEMSIAADMAANQSAYQSYVLHRLNADILHDQFMNQPSLPSTTIDEWQREVSRANVYRNQLSQDYLRAGDGGEFFDADKFQQAMRAEAASQKPLDAAPFSAQADAQRRRLRFFVAMSVGLTAALFFLTLALQLPSTGRKIWTVVGVLLYGGIVLLTVWKSFS